MIIYPRYVDLDLPIDFQDYEVEGENNQKTHYQIRGDDGYLLWVFQRDFKIV